VERRSRHGEEGSAMAIAQRMDPATYERLAVLDEFKRTELWDGVPVEKPTMSQGHGDALVELTLALRLRIDRVRGRVRVNHAKLAIPGGNFFIPDLAILPADAFTDPTAADLFHVPAFLVVEVWSPSTGSYDIDVKLPAYRARGDAEIWRVYPPERSITRWVRRPDGAYLESVVTAGRIALAALPDVEIDVADVFRA
jgi:Uma2 family endonuclease